ncbi:MAG: 30S ribosomal protein S2 [Candidatus Paceibacterota bacterium]
MTAKTDTSTDVIKELFSVGAHLGYRKARRHPSMKRYVYGVKDNQEIINLEHTKQSIEDAQAFLKDIAAKGGMIQFLGGKKESQEAVERVAKEVAMPYVLGRWIGGTFTNFAQIRRQVDKLIRLRDEREKGDLEKYTKREQLTFDREIVDLEKFYGGMTELTKLPSVLVVIDPTQEQIAVDEALHVGVPIVALANTDCNISEVDHAIPCNDHSKSTINLIIGLLGDAIKEGQAQAAENNPKANADEGEKAPAKRHKVAAA